MQLWFMPEVRRPPQGSAANEGQARGQQDMGKQAGAWSRTGLKFTFATARSPASTCSTSSRGPRMSVEPKPESRALAFNLDVRAEGSLRRAVADDIVQSIAGSERRDYVRFYTSGSDSFTDLKGKEADLSKAPGCS